MNYESLVPITGIIRNISQSNWMRLGKIVPDKELKGTPYFSEQYVRQILAQLQNEDAKELKNRRNKITGIIRNISQSPNNCCNQTITINTPQGINNFVLSPETAVVGSAQLRTGMPVAL